MCTYIPPPYTLLQVSVLRGELLVAQAKPTPVAMEIQGLKEKVCMIILVDCQSSKRV